MAGRRQGGNGVAPAAKKDPASTASAAESTRSGPAAGSNPDPNAAADATVTSDVWPEVEVPVPLQTMTEIDLPDPVGTPIEPEPISPGDAESIEPIADQLAEEITAAGPQLGT